MSQDVDYDYLYEKFIRDLEQVTCCAYCGSETEGPCCGENHHEALYLYNDELYQFNELESLFSSWLADQAEKDTYNKDYFLKD